MEVKDLQVQPRRPKTRATTRKEKHEKEPSPPQAYKDTNDTITAEFEENKEYELE